MHMRGFTAPFLILFLTKCLCGCFDDFMSEVLFYHLEHQSLEQVLPLLLEKTLDRGWRAVVQASSDERLESLSASLWTWRDDAFLPHGDSEGFGFHHILIWNIVHNETPNKANVRFCVDGATSRNIEDFERTIYMFDGSDPVALDHARQQWKVLKDSDHEITYWRQGSQGKWEKKA